VRLRLTVTVVVAGVALVGLVGCGKAKAKPAPSAAGPSAAASSLSPRAEAEGKATAAYLGLWQAMAKAGEVPDPNAPELRQYADGDALARVVRALVTYQQDGEYTQGAPVDDPKVTSDDPQDVPTTVNLTDCGDSTNWTTHKQDTKAEIPNDQRGRRLITATVKKLNGTWKVTTFQLGDIGSC
jgi:hypothetical protein